MYVHLFTCVVFVWVSTYVLYITMITLRKVSTVNVLIRTYVLCDCSDMPPGVVTLQVVPYK